MNHNENVITEILWDAAKTVLRGKFTAIQPYLKKTRKTSNREPIFEPKTTGKRRTKTPKISRRNKIIKIRAEINERNSSND